MEKRSRSPTQTVLIAAELKGNGARKSTGLLTSSQRSSFSLKWTPCSSVRAEVKIVGFLFSMSVKQFPETLPHDSDEEHLGFFILEPTNLSILT